MDQFIREVDEEYRRDRIAQIWKRFGGLIVGAAILIVAGVGGYRYWEHVETERAAAAGAKFQDAVQLARDGKGSEADQALAGLAASTEGGYRLLARFRLAAEKGAANPADGATAFDGLAADPGIPQGFRELGRLRAAMLRLDGDQKDAAVKALEVIAQPDNPFRHTAREMLGVSALARGETEAAGRWFDAIAADRTTPQGLRGRMEIYAALVAGGPVKPAP